MSLLKNLSFLGMIPMLAMILSGTTGHAQVHGDYSAVGRAVLLADDLEIWEQHQFRNLNFSISRQLSKSSFDLNNPREIAALSNEYLDSIANNYRSRFGEQLPRWRRQEFIDRIQSSMKSRNVSAKVLGAALAIMFASGAGASEVVSDANPVANPEKTQAPPKLTTVKAWARPSNKDTGGAK